MAALLKLFRVFPRPLDKIHMVPQGRKLCSDPLYPPPSLCCSPRLRAFAHALLPACTLILSLSTGRPWPLTASSSLRLRHPSITQPWALELPLLGTLWSCGGSWHGAHWAGGSRMLPARERAEEGRPPHQRRDRERPAARSWPWPWTRPAGICRLHPPPEFHWLWELSTPHPWRKEVFLPGAHRSGSWSRRTPRGPTKWHECRDVPATGEDQGSSRSQRGPGEPPVYKRLG